MILDAADKKLAEILAEHGKSNCPNCNRIIDRGDVAWNNGSTEGGTEWTWVQIQCQACDTEIIHFSSWWPGADDFSELVYNVLDQDWP